MLDQILIVDDDGLYRHELVGFLKDEFNIIEAIDGEKALQLFRRPNNISLILLDLRMPGVDGLGFLREIKKINPQVTAIILTGFAAKDNAIECLREHADDFIEKKSGPDHIRKTILKHLDIKRGEYNLDEMKIGSKLKVVKRYIERNWYNRVQLSNAAKLIKVSPKYLSKVFKEKTGMSFNDFRLSAKIEQSKKFLETTEMSVDLIAEKLGYLNTESFIRAFKKITGLTPAAFRKKNARPAGKGAGRAPGKKRPAEVSKRS